MTKRQTEGFNAIADKVAADLQPLKKAIAVMKEMQSWGDAPEGHFTFKVVQDPFCFRPILVGELDSHKGMDRGYSIPTIFVGLQAPLSAPVETEFMIVPIISNRSEEMSDRIREAYKDAEFPVIDAESPIYNSAATADKAVVNFARVFMANHPGYKRILEDAAQKFINKIPTKTPAPKA